jgi:hypothetical protein
MKCAKNQKKLFYMVLLIQYFELSLNFDRLLIYKFITKFDF